MRTAMKELRKCKKALRIAKSTAMKTKNGFRNCVKTSKKCKSALLFVKSTSMKAKNCLRNRVRGIYTAKNCMHAAVNWVRNGVLRGVQSCELRAQI